MEVRRRIFPHQYFALLIGHAVQHCAAQPRHLNDEKIVMNAVCVMTLLREKTIAVIVCKRFRTSEVFEFGRYEVIFFHQDRFLIVIWVIS